MRLTNLAVLQKLAEMRGDFDLSGVRTRRVNPRIESDWRIAQSFERHRSGDVRDVSELLGAIDRQPADGSHSLGPVQEREPFFCFELNRLDFCQTQRRGARHSFAAVKRFALADDSQRKVRERSEIAARAN